MDAFLEGYAAREEVKPEQHYIYRDEDEVLIESFTGNDTVIIAFPLYTDSVPGKVKYFLEQLGDLEWKEKRIGVIVQSGFPEAIHTSFIAGYFERLVRKMGAEYIGSVIRGRCRRDTDPAGKVDG